VATRAGKDSRGKGGSDNKWWRGGGVGIRAKKGNGWASFFSP